MTVKVRRVLLGNEHDDQKWIVLEGSIDGVPQVTKRRTLSTAALADGSLSLADEQAKLVADVNEYHARWLTVQALLPKLKQ